MAGDGPVVRRNSWIVFAGLTLAAVLGVAGLVLLGEFGIPSSLIDGGYWTLGVLLATLIALTAHNYRDTAGSAIVSGLSAATAVVSGAFILALTGAIFSWGHDGLAFGIGLGAGCLLLQLVIAPRMAQAGTTSLAELFAMRFPGRMTRVTCAGVIALSMLTLLVAELMAAGLIGARVLGIGYAAATAVAAVVVLACFALRGLRGAAWTNGAPFPLLLIALAVPLVILSAVWYGVPLPQIAYANALWQVQGLEEMLLEQDLADPAFMRPMLTPFVALTPTNFLGIVLGLAAGAAVLPAVLGLSQTAQGSARSARSAALWTLGFVVLLLTLFPVAAAYAKLSLATLVADRTPIAELPAWVFTYGQLGLLQICERAATDVESVIAACAALPDAGGALALHSVAIDPDAVLLAMPEMTGLSGGAFGLLAVAALAVVLTTALGPLGAAVQALLGDGDSGVQKHVARARGPYALGLALAALFVGVAAAIASRHPAGV
ncbi:MAG TPA: hypothetical protein VNR51_10140, partial [Hyphomicrobium sp.]|nr:hypothetical protein [Hyphomicrobium sp.]